MQSDGVSGGSLSIRPRRWPGRWRERRSAIPFGGALCLLAQVLASCLPASASAAPASVELNRLIKDVRVKPATFLPTLGEKVEFSLRLVASGRLSASVLDRDGYVVRILASKKQAKAGRLALTWDGRNNEGAIVPDEAYSLLLELETTKSKELYFPANQFGEMYEVAAQSYSRRDAAVAFELPRASRVHMQAGQAVPDPDLGRNVGPVLKTILNREPKPAGRVLATWNGLDESGTVMVPNLPHFVIGIACTPLPENSVIATGNRSKAFIDYVSERKGSSRITASPEHRHHHLGLSTEDDLSPVVSVAVREGVRGGNNCWLVTGQTMTLSVELKGPTASSLRTHPGRVFVFRGVEKIADVDASVAIAGIKIEFPKPLTETTHLVVNWASEYGPTAPGVFCVEPARTGVARMKGEMP